MKVESQCGKLLVKSEDDADEATRRVRHFAEQYGFSVLEANLIASAVSELATNLFLHAGQGVIEFKETERRNGLEIVVSDHGPGIADVDQAMVEGYSTRTDGLGLGLSAAQKAVKEFELSSTLGSGTTIKLRHYLSLGPENICTGVATLADPDYSCNGDLVYQKIVNGDTRLIAVIDGMGQGEEARAAADLASNTIASSNATCPCVLANEAHLAVYNSDLERGFAMALLLANSMRLRLVTVGDVSCRVFGSDNGDELFRFTEKPGVLGSNFQVKFVEQCIDITQVTSPLFVVLATDGVSTNFEASGDPIVGEPVDIAHIILRRFKRSFGDATVAVLRIGT